MVCVNVRVTVPPNFLVRLVALAATLAGCAAVPFSTTM
jgi:hypothetical protein